MGRHIRNDRGLACPIRSLPRHCHSAALANSASLAGRSNSPQSRAARKHFSAGINAPARERALPGSSREIPGEIATAALFGGALGAGFGGLQKLFGLGAKALPVTVRDDVNAAANEAQLNFTNPFPAVLADGA